MNHIKNMFHKGDHSHDHASGNSSGDHHAKATHDGHVIADATHFEVVEGNIYFPIDSIKDHSHVLTATDKSTSCPWKGQSRYYDVQVDGKTLKNAAWDYPEPSKAAENIRGHVAFDKNQVTTSKS